MFTNFLRETNIFNWHIDLLDLEGIVRLGRLSSLKVIQKKFIKNYLAIKIYK